ncbi:DUF6538 domain-containing protein [Bradyrhizobium sp.]|uniref:DUF6538 domain-containing protein n=1 Tax=Bradyrhizobium sp. TaxID=376 RepID=UPI002DDCD242|nr:DUF6538 domain-containing protein [Bradyrhizobium sp.]HEV2159314.1 DUF6538 domain-containing protein [Bradyrhizobium sp.]
MAVDIFRRSAVYYWRRRVPRSLANLVERPHLFLSLKTTSRTAARRLAAQLDVILEDAAMLADSFDPHLSKSQIEAMLRRVVDRQLVKLDRLAYAAKSSSDFDLERDRMGEKQVVNAY